MGDDQTVNAVLCVFRINVEEKYGISRGSGNHKCMEEEEEKIIMCLGMVLNWQEIAMKLGSENLTVITEDAGIFKDESI